MLNHIMCLAKTIICSSHVLKMIECIRWIVIIFTFIFSGICACKILKMSKDVQQKID